MSKDKDLLDHALTIGASFDWITPLVGFIGDTLSGNLFGGGDFGIKAYHGYDRKDIKRLMRKNGINVWGIMYNLENDTLMFAVKPKDAKFAKEILTNAGVPVVYSPI